MPNPEDRVDGGIAEKLEFEPVERKKSGRKWGRMVGFLVLVGVLSGGAWVLWGKQFIAAGRQGDVPIIRADITPIKIRPADPGGMDVPDRDKLVYNRLNGEGAGNDVERLLPPPEEPLPVPETAAPEPAESEPAAMPEPSETAAETVKEGMPTELQPVPLEPQPAAENTPPPPPPSETAQASALDATSEPPAAPEPVAETAPEPSPEPDPVTAAPEPAPEPEPAATQSARLPTSDTYRIQLAALRSQDRAEAEWKRLRSAHTDLLGRLGLSIVRVDLGEDKGVFYRLRAGPLNDAAAAKALCGKLSERNVGCLVVRPGT